MSRPVVIVAAMLAATLAGCTSDESCGGSSASRCTAGGRSATVHVVLNVEGGPAPGRPQPIPGTVSLRGDSASYRVAIAESGEASIDVRPGVYTATGTGPMFSNAPDACAADKRLHAREDRTVTVRVVCDIR